MLCAIRASTAAARNLCPLRGPVIGFGWSPEVPALSRLILSSPDGARVLDRAACSRAGGRTGRRRVAGARPDEFCLHAGGGLTYRTLDRGGPPWRIGVEHSIDASPALAVVRVFTGAVATSATSHRGTHLVDACTGPLREGVASVIVVAGSLSLADIDAMAVYDQGPAAARWRGPGRSALVVGTDGRRPRSRLWCLEG